MMRVGGCATGHIRKKHYAVPKKIIGDLILKPKNNQADKLVTDLSNAWVAL